MVHMSPDDDAPRGLATAPQAYLPAEARDAADADTTVMDLPLQDYAPEPQGYRPGGTAIERPAHEAMTPLDLPPPPALSWGLSPEINASAHDGSDPRRQPAGRPATKPLLAAADSWGETSLAFDANTAAGISYLFGWVSGLLIYFNERTNRYVRFHALQSILFNAVVVIFGVFASILASLAFDLARVTGLMTLTVLGGVIAICSLFVVVVVWSWLMVAAWTGHRAQIPVPVVGAVIRHYAERYAAPPIRQPTK